MRTEGYELRKSQPSLRKAACDPTYARKIEGPLRQKTPLTGLASDRQVAVRLTGAGQPRSLSRCRQMLA